MKNAYKLVMLVTMLLSLAASTAMAASTQCSAEPFIPDEDTVNRAVLAHIGKVEKLVSYKVGGMSCRMNKKGEEVWTIDYKASVVYTPETARQIGRKTDTYTEKVRIVAEGEKWFLR